MIWTIETKINCLRNNEPNKRWIDKQESDLEVHNYVGNTKPGGGNIVIWECMTAAGVRFAKHVERRMDSNQYIQILDSFLPPILDESGLEGESAIFQHDNDPKHTSKVTRNWLEKKKPK